MAARSKHHLDDGLPWYAAGGVSGDDPAPVDDLEPDAVAAYVGRVFVDRVPHNLALGLRIVRFGQGRVVATLPWRAELVGNPDSGVLHGGVVTSLVDATCGAAVYERLQSRVPIATLDLRIDYLRPAAAQRGLVCEARCDKVGRTIAFVRAVAHDGDPSDPVATSSSTFMVFRERSGGGA